MAGGSPCHMKNQNNVKIKVAYTKHFATKSNVSWIPPPKGQKRGTGYLLNHFEIFLKKNHIYASTCYVLTTTFSFN